MAKATGVVAKGGSLSQALKAAGFDASVYNSKSAWDTVAKANNLDSKYTVFAGQKLNFSPLINPTQTAPATPTTAKTTVPTATVGASTPTTATRTPLPVTPETPAPTDPTQLKDYLNGFQNTLNTADNYNALPQSVDGQTVKDFATNQLGVDVNAAPTAPKYTELFTTLREQYGIDNIETGINEYKDLLRKEQLLLKEQTNSARAGVTRQGVIEGRVDQATKDRQIQMQWYQDNISFLTDQANSAYSYINTIMSLTEKDYTTAKDEYQSEFNNRLSIYNIVTAQQKDQRDFNYQLQSDATKLASTNLSMYMGLITSGSLTWDAISKTDQTAIHKMEVQAGLGVGFLSQVKAPAGSEVKQIIQRTDPNTGISYADIIGIGKDGSLQKLRSIKLGQADLTLAQQLQVKSTGVSKGGGTSSNDKTIAAFNKSLGNPGYTVVATSAQENAAKQQQALTGKNYLTREQLIKRLTSQYPSIDSGDIARAVYGYYPDK